MPKVGMEPVRRAQICAAAATVISERGFSGATMRDVADAAGVSTGMINHYFSSRADLLENTLVFVSQKMQDRAEQAIQGRPAGERRLRALLRAILPREPEVVEAWRVWIASFGEAVRDDDLRSTIEGRLHPWYGILDAALDGHGTRHHGVPLAWEFDAVLNGLVLQYLTARPDLTLKQLEDALVAFVRDKHTSVAR